MPARSRQQQYAIDHPRIRHPMPRMGQFGARVVDQIMGDTVMFMVGGTAGGKVISRVADAKFVGKMIGKVRSVGKQ